MRDRHAMRPGVASTGEIRAADLYDGSFIDLRQSRAGWDRPGFDAAGWQSGERSIPIDPSLIEPRVAPRQSARSRIHAGRLRAAEGRRL